MNKRDFCNIASALVDVANKKGGYDNTTVIVVKKGE